MRTDGATHVVDRAGHPVLRITTAATGTGQGLGACAATRSSGSGWWSGWFESRTPAWLVGSVLDGAALPLAVLTVLSRGDGSAGLEVRLRDGQLEAGWASACGTASHPDRHAPAPARFGRSTATRSAGEN